MELKSTLASDATPWYQAYQIFPYPGGERSYLEHNPITNWCNHTIGEQNQEWWWDNMMYSCQPRFRTREQLQLFVLAWGTTPEAYI